MKYTVDLIGELTEENGLDIVGKLRSIWTFNDEMLNLYVNPIELYDEVTIVICSNGGRFDMLSLILDEIENLREQGVRITTKASAMAYSAGIYLLLAGDERIANDTTSFMLHEFQLSTGFDSLTGNLDYLSHQKNIQDNLDKWVIERTSMTKEELDDLKGRNLWLTKSECIELGILTDPNKEPELPTISVEQCIDNFEKAGYKVIKEESKCEMDEEVEELEDEPKKPRKSKKKSE